MYVDRTQIVQLDMRLRRLSSHFIDSPQYRTTVLAAHEAFSGENYGGCVQLLDSLPTVETLLLRLIDSLKGKSVHKTLVQIERESEGLEDGTKIKALSSLLTHTMIEVEHGNVEYRMLVPWIVRQLNALVDWVE